jgi:hypothetical protein
LINKGSDNSTNSTAKEYQREPGKLEVPNLKLDFNTSRDFERKAGQDPLEFYMTNQMGDMKLDKDFLPPGGGSGELQNFKNNTLAPDTLIRHPLIVSRNANRHIKVDHTFIDIIYSNPNSRTCNPGHQVVKKSHFTGHLMCVSSKGLL